MLPANVSKKIVHNMTNLGITIVQYELIARAVHFTGLSELVPGSLKIVKLK